MNIYLLESREDVGYEAAQGFVVIAEDARRARKAVAEEPPGTGLDAMGEADRWLDPKRSKITGIGRATSNRRRIVMRDTTSA